MAIEGELSGFHRELVCADCGTKMPLQVCESAAGYYLGYWCDECGPRSRETGYFRTYEEANTELAEWLYEGVEPDSARNTEYAGGNS